MPTLERFVAPRREQRPWLERSAYSPRSKLRLPGVATFLLQRLFGDAMPNNTVPHPHQLLTPATVRVGLPGQTKDEVINALLDVVETHPGVKDPEAMRQAVFDRERMMSTGVGKGLGLPHAKTQAVSETLAAFAITAEPVDFGAIDDQKVQLVFLLVGTEAAKSEHIKILSRISRLLNRDAFRNRLLKARNVREVLTLLEEGEMELETR